MRHGVPGSAGPRAVARFPSTGPGLGRARRLVRRPLRGRAHGGRTAVGPRGAARDHGPARLGARALARVVGNAARPLVKPAGRRGGDRRLHRRGARHQAVLLAAGALLAVGRQRAPPARNWRCRWWRWSLWRPLPRAAGIARGGREARLCRSRRDAGSLPRPPWGPPLRRCRDGSPAPILWAWLPQRGHPAGAGRGSAAGSGRPKPLAEHRSAALGAPWTRLRRRDIPVVPSPPAEDDGDRPWCPQEAAC